MNEDFRCRMISPYNSKWETVSAKSPEDAANIFHRDTFSCSEKITITDEEGDPKYDILFARIEVEGYSSYVSRIYRYRLYRRGGVKLVKHIREEKFKKKLESIAKVLNWKKDPILLLESGWIGEE